jgi:hypothetical protein
MYLKAKIDVKTKNITYLKKGKWYLLIEEYFNEYKIVDETKRVNSYLKYYKPSTSYFYSIVELRKLKIEKLLKDEIFNV